MATLQRVYLNSDEPAANRIKAAAAAIGYERPKLAATGVVIVDFRERVRQARLKATAKLIEHMPIHPSRPRSVSGGSFDPEKALHQMLDLLLKPNGNDSSND